MTTLTLSKEDMVEQFMAGAEQLAAAVEELSEAELDFAPAEGGWSIRQIVHHLADDGDA